MTERCVETGSPPWQHRSQGDALPRRLPIAWLLLPAHAGGFQACHTTSPPPLAGWPEPTPPVRRPRTVPFISCNLSSPLPMTSGEACQANHPSQKKLLRSPATDSGVQANASTAFLLQPSLFHESGRLLTGSQASNLQLNVRVSDTSDLCGSCPGACFTGDFSWSSSGRLD